MGLEPAGDGRDSLGVLAALEARELTGLHEVALGNHGLLPVDVTNDKLALVLEPLIECVALLADDGRDLQTVLLGELEVALVAARNAHDRTSTVVHEHVIGDPDGHGATIDGIDHIASGGHTVLLAIGPLALHA